MSISYIHCQFLGPRVIPAKAGIQETSAWTGCPPTRACVLLVPDLRNGHLERGSVTLLPLTHPQVADGCKGGCCSVSSSTDQLSCGIAAHIASSQYAGDCRAHPQVGQNLPTPVERHEAIEELGVWSETRVRKNARHVEGRLLSGLDILHLEALHDAVTFDGSHHRILAERELCIRLRAFLQEPTGT